MYEDFGNDLPLGEEHLRVVRKKYRLLVESISLKDGLLDDMMSEGCITWQQKLAISEMRSSEFDKNGKLLDILMKRSVAHFNTFIKCLKRNRQHHVKDLLEINIGKSQHLLKSHFFVANEVMYITSCQTQISPFCFYKRFCIKVIIQFSYRYQ